jgi:phospholipid transport system substrate-binding protein
MTSILRTLASTLVLGAALAFASPAFAGEAQDLVQARRSAVAALLKSPPSADRDQKVAATLSSLFDYDTMAERSLGKSWADLNDDQKAEFKSVLKQLIQRNIEKNVKTTMNYDVEFLGEEQSAKGMVVKTKATSKTNQREEPLSIDYVMHKTDGGMRSTDIVTEGSSLVNSYRSQFTKIIAKDGFATLIKKMKAKLASGR